MTARKTSIATASLHRESDQREQMTKFREGRLVECGGVNPLYQGLEHPFGPWKPSSDVYLVETIMVVSTASMRAISHKKAFIGSQLAPFATVLVL